MSATRVVFGGPVKVLWSSPDGTLDRVVTDEAVVRSFDGSTYRETEDGRSRPVEVSVYLQDGEDTRPLYALGVRGGVLRFEWREERRELWLTTEYVAPRALTGPELQALLRFTRGQWSDGAGPDFVGELEDRNGGTSPLAEPRELHVVQRP